MSLSGTDGFSAGTPDKRSSQPFGNNPRRDHVKNPTQSERTFTEGRSDDTTSTRTNTSDESFAEYHHSAANLSPEEKADGPICLVGNGFDFSDDDVEVSTPCIVNSDSGYTCRCLQDMFLINHIPLT